MCSSSDGVENVLSATATPPASEMPNTAATHSGRFVIKTPTRPSLPRPHARKAHATSIARSHSSAYVQRVTPSAVRKNKRLARAVRLRHLTQKTRQA